ncbi:methyl-accepting chemotaxis protein [Paenibacillus puerhi]|uniref:methyl-accepting chemotaxis protein n=1 Tax=Paenibacillus puerhi TaxID=2692622 RepID=UPI001358F7F2|nr:methyl-accepting chemotaxis protein [Paenibacillus puerhi]
MMEKGNFRLLPRFKGIRLYLRTKLILAFLLILITPSLVTGILSYFSAKDEMEEQISFTVESNGELLDSFITDVLLTKMQDLESLLRMSDTLPQGMDDPGFSAKVDQYVSMSMDVMQVHLLTKNNVNEKNPLYAQSWYQNALKDTNRIAISKPSSLSKGVTSITVAKAASDHSSVLGIEFKIASINEMTRRIKIGQKGYVFLMDNGKVIINHPVLEAGSIPDDPLFDIIDNGNADKFEYMTEKGKVRIHAKTQTVTGWKYVAVAYLDEIEASSKPIFTKTFITVLVSFMFGSIFAVLFTRSITRPILDIQTNANLVSQGDLTQDINISNQDEIGDVALSFQQMKENLRLVIRQANENTLQVADASNHMTISTSECRMASEQIASAIQQISSGAVLQASVIQQAAEAVDQINMGMKGIRDSFSHVNELAVTATQLAAEGQHAVYETMHQMEDIHQNITDSNEIVQSVHERSQQIDKLVQVIGGITKQTTLLALNASIEAARAGEHGLGFAIVADEVKKLADQTKISADEIFEKIHAVRNDSALSVKAMSGSTKSVESGLQVSKQTIDKFHAIQDGVSQIALQFDKVSNTVYTIDDNVQQVKETMNKLLRIAQENTDSSEDAVAATEEQASQLEEVNSLSMQLKKLTNELEAVVGRFKV